MHTYVWRKGLAVTSAEGRAEGLAHGEGRVPALPLGHHGRDGLFLKPRSGPWPGGYMSVSVNVLWLEDFKIYCTHSLRLLSSNC